MCNGGGTSAPWGVGLMCNGVGLLRHGGWGFCTMGVGLLRHGGGASVCAVYIRIQCIQ